MRRRNGRLALLAFAVLFGCSNHAPRHPLRDAEKRLGTDDRLNWSFHQVVEDPSGFGFRFPGYLIGIEKADREVLEVDAGAPGVEIDDKPAAWEKEVDDESLEERQDKLESILDDGKRTFISHLVAYDWVTEPIHHTRARFLHNAYEISKDEDEYEGAWNSDPKGTQKLPVYAEGKSPYINSWEALEKLRSDLAYRFRTGPPVTHIFLFSMGWNTPEYEALRNYNSLFGNLLDQAARTGAKDFNPIFIGLSWPSQWTYPGISYFNKANDADEVGFLWANKLVNDVLLSFKKEHGCRVVVVGHSFGARLVSRAVFSAPVLRLQPEEKVDLLISLEGAYSINRYLAAQTQSWEGAPYSSYADKVRKVVLTWSEYDTANPIANRVTGADNVGGEPGFKKASKYKDLFDLKTWTADPPWSCPDCGDSGKILMVNASDLVRYSTFEKGGHAHSDIYHPKMGAFLWQLVVQFAPGPAAGAS